MTGAGAGPARSLALTALLALALGCTTVGGPFGRAHGVVIIVSLALAHGVVELAEKALLSEVICIEPPEGKPGKKRQYRKCFVGIFGG